MFGFLWLAKLIMLQKVDLPRHWNEEKGTTAGRKD